MYTYLSDKYHTVTGVSLESRNDHKRKYLHIQIFIQELNIIYLMSTYYMSGVFIKEQNKQLLGCYTHWIQIHEQNLKDMSLWQ